MTRNDESPSAPTPACEVQGIADATPVPREYHRWHRHHEIFDKIVIRIQERWKTSGLSGDEWRFSAITELYSKGHLIAAGGYGNEIDRALALAPWFIVQVIEGTTRDDDIERSLQLKHKREEQLCDQPGCPNPWTVRLRLKKVTASDGHFLDPEEYSYWVNYRRFCEKHEHRGDCSREDADDNYEVIERREPPPLGILPDGSPRQARGDLAPVAEMLRGLVRAAEFIEQQDGGRVWDDEVSRALDAARRRGWGRHKVGSLDEREIWLDGPQCISCKTPLFYGGADGFKQRRFRADRDHGRDGICDACLKREAELELARITLQRAARGEPTLDQASPEERDEIAALVREELAKGHRGPVTTVELPAPLEFEESTLARGDNDVARAAALDVLERGVDFSKLPPRIQQLVMRAVVYYVPPTDDGGGSS